MVKVYSFDWDEDDPVFDFKLLGMLSPINKEYDFAFYLNKNCNFKFQRVEDHKIFYDKTPYTFALYRFYDLKTKQTIELISNYSYPQSIKLEKESLFDEFENIQVLIPEYRIFNYFLKFNFSLDQEFYVTLQNLEFLKDYQEVELEKIKIHNLENLILPT